MSNIKIKIFTRSMNYELYCYSQHLITLPFERVRITNAAADEYLYRIIEDDNCDIAINIDEDAFVINEQAILDLIAYVIENDYANAGMADGEEVIIRGQNPIVTNPFFNIFNLKLIRTRFHIEDVLSFDYTRHIEDLKAKLPPHLLQHKIWHERDNAEPYYQFFFWLAYNYKTLYLPAKQHEDGFSTILMNHLSQQMVLHTWYSREYKKEVVPFHTIRIFNRISEVSKCRNIPATLSFLERFHARLDKLSPYVHKICRKYQS